MEECELCGSLTKSIYLVNVEDVELRVCAKCAQGKKVIASYQDGARPSPRTKAARGLEETPIIENYGEMIRQARERMQLPLKVLAEMINEKETFLRRVEQQQTLPGAELVKKLEKALGIKLAEQGKEPAARVTSRQNERITLGDYLDIKKK